MPFSIIRNDITRVAADAIVNTANPEPTYGAGTDQAIYEAAGKEKLLKARARIGRLSPGQAAVTPAFDLQAKYIIHTVGPVWTDGSHREKETLRQCYRSSLALAASKRCRSIAFPLIAAGSYGFPRDEALNIAVDEIRSFLEASEMTVTLVVFDKTSFELSGKLQQGIRSYIDDRYAALHDATRHENARSTAARRRMESFEDFGSVECNRSVKASAPMDAMIVQEEAVQWEPAKEKRLPKRSLDHIKEQVGENFAARLFRLIDERELTDAEVYKRANLDKKLFSKIRCRKDYKPKKETALALCIALQLNLDETRDLLSRAGYALSPSSLSDLILEYFIKEEVYDIYTINCALFEHEQPLLGSF